MKEDDLEVVLSPQRRSFGGGCQGNAALPSISRRPVSPLENKENESLRLVGSRRSGSGSGRIMTARTFERDLRTERDLRPDKERDRDFKDKRFRVCVQCSVHFYLFSSRSCFLVVVHSKYLKGLFVIHTQDEQGSTSKQLAENN